MPGSAEVGSCLRHVVSGAYLALRGEILALLELQRQVGVFTVMMGQL
jgi:hypothetical protein